MNILIQHLMVEGHTNSVGKKNNLKLSEKRAKSVLNFLTEKELIVPIKL